jgi:sulfite exporter TauE/SafE
MGKKKDYNKVNVQIEKSNLYVNGMTCEACAKKITARLQQEPAIKKVEVDFISTKCFLSYDRNKITLDDISNIVSDLDYSLVTKGQRTKYYFIVLGIAIIVAAVYLLAQNLFGFGGVEITEETNLAMLFVIGLLSSFHCVAMCGGICLTQTIKYISDNTSKKFRKVVPTLLYNVGRVLSYTLIGGAVGLIGSAFSFSSVVQGIIKIAAGLLMLIIGLNTLNIFPWLKKITPRMPSSISNKLNSKVKDAGPFFIGLLNGFMPCTPLMAMQLYALGTGSWYLGMLSMLLFGLGTIPLMFIFGCVGSITGKKFKKTLATVSSVLVVVLGFFMFTSGFTLAGITFDNGGSGAIAEITDGTQNVSTTVSRTSYGNINVKPGVKVKWTMNGSAGVESSCIRFMNIPEYKIKKTLTEGTNTVTFTPTKNGTYTVRCDMGMYTGKIIVSGSTPSASFRDVEQIDLNFFNKQSILPE